MTQTLKIGIAGLGTVGAGVVRALKRNSSLIAAQAGARIQVGRVAELDASRIKGLPLPKGCRQGDLRELVEDPDIPIIVELIGGTVAAKTLMLDALKAGKHVVTANKALLAKHWRLILNRANSRGCAVGFESSVMAGVPVIRSLENGLAGNRVHSILGILNGTSNFVLTCMAEHHEEFPDALDEARKRGLCEADASLDTEGYDATQKLAILASIATGKWLRPGRIFREGIGHIQHADLLEAREQFGYILRPLAILKIGESGVEARVHPTLVPADHPLAAVAHEFNAAMINTDAAGPITLIGKGAGAGPAASGVVSDIIGIARHLTGEAGGAVPVPFLPSRETLDVVPMAEQTSKYYLRFSVIDKPGVLSYISGVLGKHDVSIVSVHQRGRSEKGAVPVVIITHEALEGNIRKALAQIDRARKIVKRRTVAIRIEE